jgi:hypothetical protein
MRALKHEINYPLMVKTIATFPDLLEARREIFEAVANDVKERLEARDGELIHGDFWTGKYVSFILHTHVSSPAFPTKKKKKKNISKYLKYRPPKHPLPPRYPTKTLHLRLGTQPSLAPLLRSWTDVRRALLTLPL